MSCNLTNGYTLGCRDGFAGIQEFYVGIHNGGLLTYTLGTDNIIGTFSGATVSFYTFEQELESASFDQPAEVSNENGVTLYNQTFVATLVQLNASLRNKIMALCQGKWRIIIKDQNGRYWLMGYQNPVRVSAASIGLGKAGTDLNGAVLTFSTKEKLVAYEVSAAAALSVISA